jgi:antagonist of KipI
MSLLVVRAGLLTSVQDLGRYGLQHLGIVPGGAMDAVAHRIANALVGNPGEAATLECTVLGPTLVAEHDALIALYGAAFEAKADGLPLPRNRPVLIRAGTTLATGTASRGARAYLAIAGGFQVPAVLGSRSTYIPAEFGGLSGRAVKAGDRLPGVADQALLSASRFDRLLRREAGIDNAVLRSVHWFAAELNLPSGGAMNVRAMKGRHHAQFDGASQAAFFGQRWRIAPDSNRMGYRLEGPRLTRTRPVDILSEPTCLGTVQVPNDGAPIALMADRQTTGGYPKIAEIAGADIPGLAQLAPGASVRFVKCSVKEADAARLAADERLRSVLRAIASIYAEEGGK